MSVPEAVAQAQLATDLRQRMLRNLAEGKPSTEGISQEELSKAIESLRSSGRTRAAEAATKGRAAASKGKGKTVVPDKDLFASLGLDVVDPEV